MNSVWTQKDKKFTTATGCSHTLSLLESACDLIHLDLDLERERDRDRELDELLDRDLQNTGINKKNTTNFQFF